jgi:hypothetical protein
MSGLLDSETDWLDAETVKELGDPITYNGKSIFVFGDHRDKTEAFAGAQITAQDIEIEVLKSDVAMPTKSDRIYLPQLKLWFNPVSWPNNRDGRFWHIYLKHEPL